MIKQVNGNILNATEDIICHQVNCKGVMGSGLAKQIRAKYPEVFKYYKRILETHGSQLGHCQLVACHDEKGVANLFGQDGYGRDKIYTDYDALKQSFEELLCGAKQFNFSIALPYNIGCGLAGGDWNIVYKMIEEIFNDYDVTIYKYE